MFVANAARAHAWSAEREDLAHVRDLNEFIGLPSVSVQPGRTGDVKRSAASLAVRSLVPDAAYGGERAAIDADR